MSRRNFVMGAGSATLPASVSETYRTITPIRVSGAIRANRDIRPADKGEL